MRFVTRYAVEVTGPDGWQKQWSYPTQKEAKWAGELEVGAAAKLGRTGYTFRVFRVERVK